jgi:hypothetical protein
LLKKGSGSCQAGYLNKEKFERLVINRIKELILTEENLRELARLVNEEMDSTSGKLTKELGIISDEITGTADRLERLYDALETGKIGIDDLAPRIRQLRMKHELLQTRKRELEISLSDRRGELADMKAVTECVEELRGLLEESDLTERKAFIRSFVREVKVTGTEVLLTYTTPIPPDKISRDMQRVLYSVHPSGDRGIRTPDLRDANAALSQLSYIPMTRLLYHISAFDPFNLVAQLTGRCRYLHYLSVTPADECLANW